MCRARHHLFHQQKSLFPHQPHRPKFKGQRPHRQPALVNHSVIAETIGTDKLNPHLRDTLSATLDTMLVEPTTARAGTAVLQRQRARRDPKDGENENSRTTTELALSNTITTLAVTTVSGCCTTPTRTTERTVMATTEAGDAGQVARSPKKERESLSMDHFVCK
jgi:hypothetical protein